MKIPSSCLVTGQPCYEQLVIITDCEVDKWREILEVNVLALCICSKEFLLSAKRRNLEQGHIININRSVSDKIHLDICGNFFVYNFHFNCDILLMRFHFNLEINTFIWNKSLTSPYIRVFRNLYWSTFFPGYTLGPNKNVITPYPFLSVYYLSVFMCLAINS